MLVAETQFSDIFSSLSGFKRLALAVSGGSDSMALLRMVLHWAARDTEIFVVTVNHGLRPDAGQEAAHVAAWCASLGIAHKILFWHHGGIATGVQAKARTARYDLMTEWCLQQDIPILLTGHTADDQAETVAMRLERTSSAASLAGIWPERQWNGIRVMRPFLNLRRSDLREFLVSVGQAWVEDPSNANIQFERVRVRQSLGGELQGFAQQAAKAQLTVTQDCGLAKTWCSAQFVVHHTGFLTLDHSAFASLPEGVADFVVQSMLRLCAPAMPKAERAERMVLAEWIRKGRMSRRTLGGAIFVNRKAVLVVGREPGRISGLPVKIPQSGVAIWDERFEISAAPGCEILPVSALGELPRRKDIPAFVQSGLPALRKDGQIAAIPHLNVGSGVSVKFLRH